MKKILWVALALVSLAGCGSNKNVEAGPSAGGAGGEKLSGKISMDGSSSLYPLAQAFGEDFHDANPNVSVDATSSGTGSGMAKFARGESDIANASRPIEEKEIEACKANGIDFIEVPIAADGICVLVSNSNSFVQHLTVDQLRKAFIKGSTVKIWKDIDPSWPADKINFYGPTSNHGMYDYFTEAICEKKGNQRDDVQQNQDYNALLSAISGDRNALGYIGYPYYEQKRDAGKAVPIDDGHGPVAPTMDTISDNSYAPLSRPLFFYVNTKAMARPEIKAFIAYALGAGRPAIKEQFYVPFPDAAYEAIKARVDAGTTGSLFMGVAPGTKIMDVLNKTK